MASRTSPALTLPAGSLNVVALPGVAQLNAARRASHGQSAATPGHLSPRIRSTASPPKNLPPCPPASAPGCGEWEQETGVCPAQTGKKAAWGAAMSPRKTPLSQPSSPRKPGLSPRLEPGKEKDSKNITWGAALAAPGAVPFCAAEPAASNPPDRIYPPPSVPSGESVHRSAQQNQLYLQQLEAEFTVPLARKRSANALARGRSRSFASLAAMALSDPLAARGELDMTTRDDAGASALLARRKSKIARPEKKLSYEEKQKLAELQEKLDRTKGKDHRKAAEYEYRIGKILFKHDINHPLADHYRMETMRLERSLAAL